MEKQPLKIALIVDSTTLSTYLADLVHWAKTQPDVALTHLIVQEIPVTSPTGSRFEQAWALYKRDGLGALLNKTLWAFTYRLEAFRLKRMGEGQHFLRQDMVAHVPNIIRVVPEISKSGFIYRYPPAAIAEITAQGFDLLLRGGGGILRGDILSVARLGVLSFHHGDNRVNRGGPPAFWEVQRRELTTGFVIQQLSDELDGGNVYVRGCFPTQPFWLLNQAQLYQRSNYYMKQLLQRIASTGALPPALESKPYCHSLYTLPTLRPQLQYLAQIVGEKFRERFSSHVLRRTSRWGVAFARRDWRTLVMHKASRIDVPKGHFLADPFVLTREGRDYCFVEDFDFAARRGHISAYELVGNEAKPLGVVLREPFHLSFPYLFEHEGRLYMVPETASNKDLRLYECVQFPQEWKLVRTIMANISAADTMIFQHGKHWWLFTNINPIGLGDHCSELSAFYSDDPVRGEWLPHAQNPLIIDPKRARNGGIIHEGETVYRVAQRQGFNHYGKGMTIRKITELTPETFAEEEVASITPEFFPNITGTHHLHSNGNITAFDYLQTVKR